MKLFPQSQHMSQKSRKRGFALLFAVLVSSLLLSIGLAIFNITIKELLLSSSGRESQFAFYSADTGLECALFWDSQFNAFSTSTPAIFVSCNNAERIVDSTNPFPGEYRRQFQIADSGSGRPFCVTVVVTKFEGPPAQTVIEARGYNTCSTIDPRRVERGIRIVR